MFYAGLTATEKSPRVTHNRIAGGYTIYVNDKIASDGQDNAEVLSPKLASRVIKKHVNVLTTCGSK